MIQTLMLELDNLFLKIYELIIVMQSSLLSLHRKHNLIIVGYHNISYYLLIELMNIDKYNGFISIYLDNTI